MATTTDVTMRPPVGASVWERELWSLLTRHIDEERALLSEYSSIAERTRSKALGYLVHVLLEDEMRHHRMFQELAASLKTDAEFGKNPVIPRIDFDQADRAEVADVASRLIEQEERDAAELKRLQHELRSVQDTTLWSILVDLMQRDTQKHIALLRFVKRRARGRRF